MELMFCLQHHWCLYICWLIQLPAMRCFVPLTLLAWAFAQDSPKYGAKESLVISLCFIMILVYIYQILFYFIHRLTATRMFLLSRGAFPVALASGRLAADCSGNLDSLSFHVLLARSLVVWYKLRQTKQILLTGKDGEELENLLQDENYV
ncbi:hypothetical protein KCU65_g1415, partial [Aureobasidium melanogenum]